MEVFPWKLPIVTKETMDINPSIFLVYFESHLLFSAQKKHTLPNLSDLLRFFEDFETFNRRKAGSENKQFAVAAKRPRFHKFHKFPSNLGGESGFLHVLWGFAI